MKIACIIPARLESTRLPRKLLLADTGKPLIEHTTEAAWQYPFAEDVVATDSGEIQEAVVNRWQWGQTCVITGRCANGTERVYKALKQIDPHGDLIDLVVNVQADEPEIKREHIEALVEAATAIPGCDMATLSTPIVMDWLQEWEDASSCKVFIDDHGYAKSFTRDPFEYADRADTKEPAYRHIGVYAYTPRFLDWYVRQDPSPGEQREGLEQLRALDAGCHVRVAVVDHPYRGIDTRADYDAFVERQKALCKNA